MQILKLTWISCNFSWNSFSCRRLVRSSTFCIILRRISVVWLWWTAISNRFLGFLSLFLIILVDFLRLWKKVNSEIWSAVQTLDPIIVSFLLSTVPPICSRVHYYMRTMRRGRYELGHIYTIVVVKSNIQIPYTNFIVISVRRRQVPSKIFWNVDPAPVFPPGRLSHLGTIVRLIAVAQSEDI